MASIRRLLRLAETQNGTAKRVLAAVPIQETWTFQAIYAEVRRQGSALGIDIVQGCLRHLCNEGLIKEVHMNEYQRVNLERAKESARDEEKAPVPQRAIAGALMAARAQQERETAKPVDLLTVMGNVSATLRKLADDVDAVALQAVADIEAAKGGQDKFNKLRELLGDVLK